MLKKQSRPAQIDLVSFDPGDVLGQGRALGDGEIILHLLFLWS